MTRCKEFYERWEKDPNWCEKCPEAVRQIENYIQLVEELEKRGVDREATMVGLTERAARPLIGEKDAIVKEKAISHVQKFLTRETPTGGKYKKKITSGDVKTVIAKLRREENQPVPLPAEKFNVIYADPPWKYDFSETESRAIESHYPTMELDEICNLKIPAADNCILFLWAPVPKIREALVVIEAWNFECELPPANARGFRAH